MTPIFAVASLIFMEISKNPKNKKIIIFPSFSPSDGDLNGHLNGHHVNGEAKMETAKAEDEDGECEACTI